MDPAFVLGLALVGVCAFSCCMVRGAEHDRAVWHVDPMTTSQRTGKPERFRWRRPDGRQHGGEARTWLGPIAELRAANDLIAVPVRRRCARRMPRASTVVSRQSSPRTVHVTYVQRSALVFGFPDYISGQSSVEASDGGSLAVWSRSGYGYSDLGVNRARVERWLIAAGVLVELNSQGLDPDQIRPNLALSRTFGRCRRVRSKPCFGICRAPHPNLGPRPGPQTGRAAVLTGAAMIGLIQ